MELLVNKLRVQKKMGKYATTEESLDFAEAMHNSSNSKHAINMEVAVKN